MSEVEASPVDLTDSCWGTPPELFKALNREFGFAVDLAANSKASSMCPSWYGPNSHEWHGGGAVDAEYCTDSLKVPWHEGPGPGFVNFPYSTTIAAEYEKVGDQRAAWYRVETWLAKCSIEAMLGYTVVAIVPASIQTQWWGKWVSSGEWPADEIRMLSHRIPFLHPVTRNPMKGGSLNHAVVIWKPDVGYVRPWAPTVRWWTYRGLEAAA